MGEGAQSRHLITDAGPPSPAEAESCPELSKRTVQCTRNRKDKGGTGPAALQQGDAEQAHTGSSFTPYSGYKKKRRGYMVITSNYVATVT